MDEHHHGSDVDPDEPADPPAEVPVVVDRPVEARAPLRHPVALLGTSVAGFAMGVAEVVPGFSGGTVALVAGIYERLVAAIRQATRALSLALRGRFEPALRALLVLDWPFIAALLVGMVAALATVASPLRALIDERPVELSAVFLGLVLGAAGLAARRLRAPSGWLGLVMVAAAAAAFMALGMGGGVRTDPSLLAILLGGMIAVSAWILPGVSGSFLLVVLGLYAIVLDALADLDLGVLLVFALGCVLGLAAFSTLLNWLLARYHDLVLAVLIGLMLGSSRVLWPWPADAGMGSPELGAPEGDAALLAAALGLVAFAAIWMLGLTATAIEQRRLRWVERREADRGTALGGDRDAAGAVGEGPLLEADVVEADVFEADVLESEARDEQPPEFGPEAPPSVDPPEGVAEPGRDGAAAG